MPAVDAPGPLWPGRVVMAGGVAPDPRRRSCRVPELKGDSPYSSGPAAIIGWLAAGAMHGKRRHG